MTEATNSKFCKFVLLMTSGMISFAESYQVILFNPITPVLQDIFNDTYMNRFNESIPESTWTSLLSVTLSSLILGGFIGAICVKPLLACMSRKRLLQACHVINLASLILVALVGKLTGSYEVFIIGRITTGFPMGIMYTLVPIMVAETSERNKQGVWQSVMGVGIGLGLWFGSIMAHPKILGSNDLWPLAVSFGGIPSIVYLVSSYWIPHTVAFVMRQGDKDKTINLLRKMREGDKASIENEYETMQEETKGCDVVGIKEVVNTKQYRLQLVVVICIFANLMLCGVNNFVFYSDRMFIRVGISSDQATFGTIGVFGLQFVVSLFGTKLIDRYGGRKVILFSCSGQIIALILFTICQATLHLAPQTLGYIIIVASAIFFACWSGGTNLASLALLGEVTIEPTRQSIIAVGGVLLWLMSWFVGFIPPYLEKSLGAYSMVLWLVCSVIFFVYFIFFLPETKGKTVDQIQQKFKATRTESCAPLSDEHKL